MTSQPALIVDTMLAEVRDGIAQYGTARTAPERSSTGD